MENSEPEPTRGEDLDRAKRRKAEADVRRGVEEHTVSGNLRTQYPGR
jgi:hypothetical protein